MTLPSVSVVIVSRGRPGPLTLCLTALAQQNYPRFELIIVADPAGLGAAKAHPIGAQARHVLYDEANISAARNLGIANAGGEIVAFIDDDAIAEPLWLRRLAEAFASDIAAATGWVRGTDGLRFDSKAARVTQLGETEPCHVDDHDFAPGEPVKTEGTNMAFRREVMIDLGGFDPAIRFYLDETDLNWRLARAGLRTAVVPNAQVHHTRAASANRNRRRAPLSLFEVGASSAVYLRKHAQLSEMDHLRRVQQRRLLRWMQRGDLSPDDVTRLLRSFDEGAEAGKRRSLGGTLPDLVGSVFSPVKSSQQPWRITGDRSHAYSAHLTTFVTFSRRFSRPKAVFMPNGVWHHSVERTAKRESLAEALFRENQRLLGIRWDKLAAFC